MSKEFLFTIADDNNLPLAKNMLATFKAFHPDVDTHIVTGDQLTAFLKDDPDFFYKAKAVVASRYIDDYDLVIGADADQLFLGDISFVLESKGWDVGVVDNMNRVDVKKYGEVKVWDIPPTEYFNAGFVAMRSERFVKHWLKICNTYHFKNYQYREQDLLNIILHYGDYKVKNFDRYDQMYNYAAWHGLKLKGETMRLEIRDGEAILPKARDGYPKRDVKAKIWHAAGGDTANKGNYKLHFSEELIKYIEGLIERGNNAVTDKH